MENNGKICKGCGGTEFIKLGVRRVKGGVRQRYQCKNRDCGCIVIGEMIAKENSLQTEPAQVKKEAVKPYTKKAQLKGGVN